VNAPGGLFLLFNCHWSFWAAVPIADRAVTLGGGGLIRHYLMFARVDSARAAV
jgi:hypothetical protein